MAFYIISSVKHFCAGGYARRYARGHALGVPAIACLCYGGGCFFQDLGVVGSDN